MKMKSTLAVLLVLVPALSTACGHESNVPAYAPATTSGVVAAVSVSAHDVEIVAKERCDREERCSNVGADRKYATRAACVERIRDDSLRTFTNAACPQGVDSSRLQACLAELRQERCDGPFDTLSRNTTCTRSVLCPSWATAVDGYVGGS
jgi:hypothetical protein